MKMNSIRWMVPFSLFSIPATFLILATPSPDESDVKNVITGKAVFDDYRTEKPGDFRKITVADLPQPYATPSAGNPPKNVPRPKDMWPKAPAGFEVQVYANEGMSEPREMRTAPNGDLFLADSQKGQIDIFRGISKEGKPQERSVFAIGLKRPFGIA